MTGYVLDASVILASVIDKDTSAVNTIKHLMKKALAEDQMIFSSCLLPLEVGNVISIKAESQAHASALYRQFLRLPITYLSFEETTYFKIMRLSQELRTTFYEASYHILAVEHNATFLTLDKKYFAKAKQLGNIELLDS